MNKKIEIREIAINLLVPTEYNPRRLSKKQYQDIVNSLERFGFVDPVIVNENRDRKNVIVGGHQRVKVAKDLGYKFVPCVFVNLTLEQERELNVRLNKNSGEWDYEALANYFDVPELVEYGFTYEELGAIEVESPEEISDEETLEDANKKIVISPASLQQRKEIEIILKRHSIEYAVK